MNSRLSKADILNRFRACCQKLGKTPGTDLFCKTTGVNTNDVRYYWPKFSDLVKEGGAIPQERSEKIPEDELFGEYAKVCLHLKKIPTLPELLITTRELRTRTHQSVLTRRFGGSLIETDRNFRAWLEKQSGKLRQILDFPGWGRKNPFTKKEKLSVASVVNYSFHPYLPACLQYLDILAKGEMPSNEDSTQSVPVLFERRCADAFRCLGFEIENLGQGKGRTADFLASAHRERFALIVDAKVRKEGYTLGTEDRKFLEYAVNHGRNLQSKGIDKIYLIIVATSFRERDLQQLMAYLVDSPIRSVDLITPSALIRIVEESIRERHSFSLAQIDKLFFGNKIINA
ncbi:MAG TPA: hypothetical protein VJA17_02535 [Candidatus Omnitrophota bacterium]|nr:hypothetical protein [Candidatus Omnitrophota bacterium]